MKDKNGFVFVETIIVCSVVAISLVTIYAAFALLLQEQKQRNKYDLAHYNYRMYTIAKELKSKGELGSCNTNAYEQKTTSLNEIAPNHLYYVEFSRIEENIPREAVYLDEYVKTIDENDDTCLLIGEFKVLASESSSGKDEYYYSHVVIDQGE